ncbi:hypothetical protein MKW98_015192 [Papaver atlanticum]|uniref:Uncharacterized protein n=1 Tax=Papaver atlanticum TaxID=357466 RepID=A0AAD4T999_9MAGN|nr:hypothetical protein MKW98_015192 [Papaver atlanticum]
MHIWPNIWFVEHTIIVVPEPLRKDKFFEQKFIDPYTENEKVVLNMSKEGGIMFLEEGREDKYEELRMTIKSSLEQMQKMDCNNEEFVPKMQEMLNKIYFKAYPDILPNTTHKNLMILYNWMMMQKKMCLCHIKKHQKMIPIRYRLKMMRGLETSAAAINPEPTPIFIETTSKENHTTPETTSSASEPKPADEDLNVTRTNKKRKASESNVQKDDVMKKDSEANEAILEENKNKKAKDKNIAVKLAEIIQKLEEKGLFKGITSNDEKSKTSLDKDTRESAKTIKNLQEVKTIYELQYG